MYFKKNYKCENCTLPFNTVWSCKIREQKIMKELYESDFHEITWDKKNPQEWSDFYLDIYEKSLI